ncbi:MAG: serine/threonine-protein kinase [Candidatus Brocadiia bacterium]
MVTPQETRFVKLAVGTSALTPDQVRSCMQLQQSKRGDGSHLSLWDCAVVSNMLDQGTAEQLVERAGDLPTESLGEFRLVQKLGEGGMGSVYLARDPEDQRVAVKILAPHLAKRRTFLTRFFREGQASIDLRHENIVSGLAIGEQEGLYYFAMEYVAGKPLARLIGELGPIPHQKASAIALQITEALVCAHSHGIIHRDIKPENIMVNTAGVAKLMDLGLAQQREQDLTVLTRTGAAMGTPDYMAPEQILNAKEADERSDIYSLGATWYHMVTGSVPFEGNGHHEVCMKHIKEPLTPVRRRREDVPRAVCRIIEQMMAKKPEDRIQSAEELRTLIRKHAGTRDVRKELGLRAEPEREKLWEVKLSVRGRTERRRLSTSEVKEAIRRGRLTDRTPTRPSAAHARYQPLASYPELVRGSPIRRAPTLTPGDGPARPSSSKLEHLLTHYDEESRAYRRGRKLRRLYGVLIRVAVALVAAGLIWLFRERVLALLVRGYDFLMGGS